MPQHGTFSYILRLGLVHCLLLTSTGHFLSDDDVHVSQDRRARHLDTEAELLQPSERLSMKGGKEVFFTLRSEPLRRKHLIEGEQDV